MKAELTLPKCKICNLSAEDIFEYYALAQSSDVSIRTYITLYEDTYDFDTNTFICMHCNSVKMNQKMELPKIVYNFDHIQTIKIYGKTSIRYDLDENSEPEYILGVLQGTQAVKSIIEIYDSIKKLREKCIDTNSNFSSIEILNQVLKIIKDKMINIGILIKSEKL
ncbi:MAG: hypothetical protein KatS3mg002_0422 [Candidatus Woesearchaeota archaeon]|nr:MAG: hypothetical protein KatS3mg002_0422 [Candidatus Woesearchaeota archaeon]